jgi:integrase
MQVEDVYVQNRRLWVRLHEKGGKLHKMPCHHSLEEYLDAWHDGSGLRHQPKAPLFPTIRRGTAWGKNPQLGDVAMGQSDAYAMVQRRAAAAGVATRIGNHTFRGTGITTYLKNGGTLEKARDMANHSDPRTTQLYDRRRDQVSLDEVEKIQL